MIEDKAVSGKGKAILDVFTALRGQYLESLAMLMGYSGTASETVYHDQKSGFKLIRYLCKPDKNPETILFIPHFINRPYILDLNRDVSVIRGFCEDGFNVYMIDWGYPGQEQANLSFSDFVQFVESSASFLPEGFTILGYCTGGIISLIYASFNAVRVRRLILLATPVDFSALQDPRILVGKIARPRLLADIFGNIPGELMNLTGTYLLMLYLPSFLMERAFAEELLSYESWRDAWRRAAWIMDAPEVPAKIYTELVEDCYQKNLFIKDQMEVGGKRVNLSRIECPLLNIMARYDHLVPVESASALQGAYSGRAYQEVLFPSSHVGLSTSRKAHQELWPKVRDWARSQQRPGEHR